MLNFIYKIVKDIIFGIFKVNENLPLFYIQVLYAPTNETKPVLYITNITNKSNSNFLIEEAYIVKRNQKYNSFIAFFKAKILINKQNYNITPFHKTHDEIIKKYSQFLSSCTEVSSLKVESKQTNSAAFILDLTDKEINYWSNFALKERIKSVKLPTGEIIPAWITSEFDWEVVLKDDKNIYWSEQVKGSHMLNKKIDFPVLLEKYRIYNAGKARIERGETIFWYLIIEHIKLLKFIIQYKARFFLLKLNFMESL